MRMLERQSAYDRLTAGASVLIPQNVSAATTLQPLLLKRQRELEEVRAFNNWLGERRLAQEGHERRGVKRAAGEVAA